MQGKPKRVLSGQGTGDRRETEGIVFRFCSFLMIRGFSTCSTYSVTDSLCDIYLFIHYEAVEFNVDSGVVA